MCESIGIEPAAAVVEPVVGGDAPEAPSHTRGVCVFVSSSSSSAAAVSLAALAAPLVRMKSSAVQVPAAVSCSSAVPTEHHRQHTRCAPPTHPQRDRPRGGVVDGSPSAQRTSSTVRRPPGSAGAGRWKTTLFLVCGRALITDVVPTSRFWTDDQDETPLKYGCFLHCPLVLWRTAIAGL